ncbi:MAG: (d)CMP kinase [Chloroflexota bacterium]|nr:(d)CMP kinase [Chloroflexota bacterium]
MRDGTSSSPPQPDLAALLATFQRLQPAIVALDGPAGSGKSTVGYQLAQQVNFLFFDTGVMYRAVTWAALQGGVDPRNGTLVDHLADMIDIQVTSPLPTEQDGRQNTVWVDGQDVTPHIRTPAVEQYVSIVSAYPLVRHALGAKQRQISQQYGTGRAEKAGVVMAGRDIGTVVVPEAPLKIYLEASAQERARRRYAELLDKGKSVALDAILDGIVQRDQLDSQRAVSPLRPAADAIILDTSALSPAEVVLEILRLASIVIVEKQVASSR